MLRLRLSQGEFASPPGGHLRRKHALKGNFTLTSPRRPRGRDPFALSNVEAGAARRKAEGYFQKQDAPDVLKTF
jgi:hypothetical protein